MSGEPSARTWTLGLARNFFVSLGRKILDLKDLPDSGAVHSPQNLERLRLTGKILSKKDLRQCGNRADPASELRASAMIGYFACGRLGHASQRFEYFCGNLWRSRPGAKR